MEIKKIINQYNPANSLQNASTPPSAWYTNKAIAQAERDSVFSANWLVAARIDQLQGEGQYFATELAGQPIVIVRSDKIRAFYNVCRHHAAQVIPLGEGCTKTLTCPYHGWTYKLDGSLANTPLFKDVCNFDKKQNGLKEVNVEVWESWVFVSLKEDPMPLQDFLGDLFHQLKPLNLQNMAFHKSVSYQLDCNWKVYVDNYLDGGYHVPFLHKGLNSALDGKLYKIEVNDRYCLQSCPTKEVKNDSNEFAQVRKGMARYYWQYPNVMFNLYEGIMGTMIVEALAVDRCKVTFDYYFEKDNVKYTEAFKNNSVDIADKIQDEDRDICESVQRGLSSKGYDTGRLSPEKEAGEHLFHKLLFQDLTDFLIQT
jgi:choline monooxygenase